MFIGHWNICNNMLLKILLTAQTFGAPCKPSNEENKNESCMLLWFHLNKLTLVESQQTISIWICSIGSHVLTTLICNIRFAAMSFIEFGSIAVCTVNLNTGVCGSISYSGYVFWYLYHGYECNQASEQRILKLLWRSKYDCHYTDSTTSPAPSIENIMLEI